jgi:hypothetical protein
MFTTSATTETARRADGEPDVSPNGADPDPAPPGGSPRKKVAITLAVGLTLLAGVGIVALKQAPPRVVRIGAPGVKAIGPTGATTIGFTTGEPTICQAGEVLPSGVSSIRLSVWAFFGPPVRLTAYQGSRLLTEGSQGGGWVGDSVTVPVKPVGRTASGVKLCFALRPNLEPMLILGANTPQRQAATFSEPGVGESENRLLNGRISVEYLARGSGSWWSRIVSVARHAGLGRAFSGTWIALLIAALMIAMGVLAVRLTLRELP